MIFDHPYNADSVLSLELDDCGWLASRSSVYGARRDCWIVQLGEGAGSEFLFSRCPPLSQLSGQWLQWLSGFGLLGFLT